MGKYAHEYTLFYSDDNIPGMGIMRRLAFEHMGLGFDRKDYVSLLDFDSVVSLDDIEHTMLSVLNSFGDRALPVAWNHFSLSRAEQHYDYVLRLESGVLLCLPRVEGRIKGEDAEMARRRKIEEYYEKFGMFMHYLVGDYY